MSDRRSYSGLLTQPAWLLIDRDHVEGERLVAAVRAATPDEARTIFKRAGLTGTHVRKSTA